MNALAKFEISSSTPPHPQSDLMDMLYGDFALPHVPTPQPLDLKPKQSGTVRFIPTHPDRDYAIVLDTGRFQPSVVFVSRSANDDFCLALPHELFRAATTEFAGSNFQFLTYAIFAPRGASTASSRLTTYFDPLSDNPTVDALASYESLNQPNWDGYDAAPITRKTLSYARRLIRIIPQTFGPPDMAPSGDGSIALEWVPETGPIHKLFLDIGPGEQWRAYWKRRNGQFGRLPGAAITPDTKRVLQKLFGELSK